ncbi:MAG: NAD(P)-dependent oxidoreductase [Desulfosalsimonadaceae bacterium]|nr:NAD(P)-dependent oxidoreductase [Desulfosalsimonadaceae bacterium]
MKIFITGSAGYVGSNLLPKLKQEKHDITCLLRFPEKHSGNTLFDDCNIIKGDVSDRGSIKGALNGADYVIHLAVSTPLTNKDNEENIYNRTNITGTKNILEECIVSKPKRIICFSSTAAIGRPIDCINEKTPLNPVNNYGISKKAADELIATYVKNYQSPVITICFPHIYGPGEVHDLLKIVRMIKKGILPQIGFGPNFLPMVYVTDAVDAIVLALERGKPGEKYLIADDDPHDIRVIRKKVLKALNIERRFYPIIPKYMGLLGAYALEKTYKILDRTPPIKAENIKSILAGRRLSIKKAKNELGFSPRVSFEEGIHQTILWYQKNNLI